MTGHHVADGHDSGLEPRESDFITAVHGTIFAERAVVVARLRAGDAVLLVPDPPGADVPAVWVHADGGDVVGYLPAQLAEWLAPFMIAGGRAQAQVSAIATGDVASWQRLAITVHCRAPSA